MEDKCPLDGVKVLDFSATVLGPTVTRYLADHGAMVIKVESTSHPETTRTAAPYVGRVPGINRSGYFATHNAGKLSLSLDMRKPKAINVAKRLVRWADIVIETFTPGVMKRWGLSYKDLRKIKPDIIMASSSLEGQTGRYARHRGYGMISASMTGWFELTGWPDGEPVGPYSAYSDFIGWNYLLISILVALDYRNRTGKGQYIDHSHVESGVHFLSPALLDYNINGRVATRVANRDPYAAPHGAYRCYGQDRWCVIAVTNDEEWGAFGRVIGNPNWFKDPKFATLIARKENEDELDKLVEGWTINHAAEEVMALMQPAGVAAGLVENAEDLFRDPQLKHRQAFVALDHREMGTYHISTAVFRSSEYSNKPRSPAPLLGEHNEYILKELLDMSDDEIAQLVAEEVLE
ncbi:MAG: CoA transferase [Dehalococcoidales bacterium]|nr:CoA transferase [Dehalococcoidales bacterium]